MHRSDSEETLRIIESLHARLDALEASFFGRVADAAKKAASGAVAMVKEVKVFNIVHVRMFSHFEKVFPGIKMLGASSMIGDPQSLYVEYKGKKFYMYEFNDKALTLHEWHVLKDGTRPVKAKSDAELAENTMPDRKSKYSFTTYEHFDNYIRSQTS